MEPLHILLTDPHLKGGGQVRYVSNLASQLTSLGHRVTIGCKRGSVLTEAARAAGCEALDAFTFRGGLRPAAWRNDIELLRSYITNEKPDIIHVSGSQDHWTSSLASRSLRHPVCIVRTRHNTYPISASLPNRVLNLRWTDYQIVVCDLVRRDLAQHAAFDAARMCTIHNGVDADLYAPQHGARAKARQEFGYDDSHIVCGISARLVEAKGHVFFFKSIAMLKDKWPQLRVLCFGQGAKEAELRALVRTLGIDDLVEFGGFRNDMHCCQQAFDIGVQPSIDCDTSSFSLKEQMALQIPVVASDYGGLVEILDSGVEGLIVPAGTVEPLAGALDALLSDASMRTKMGVAGRARVLRDFTIQVFAGRTVDAYRRALEVWHERTSR